MWSDPASSGAMLQGELLLVDEDVTDRPPNLPVARCGHVRQLHRVILQYNTKARESSPTISCKLRPLAWHISSGLSESSKPPFACVTPRQLRPRDPQSVDAGHSSPLVPEVSGKASHQSDYVPSWMRPRVLSPVVRRCDHFAFLRAASHALDSFVNGYWVGA